MEPLLRWLVIVSFIVIFISVIYILISISDRRYGFLFWLFFILLAVSVIFDFFVFIGVI
ncbi:hypothetical protein GF386_03170 [Candidatus Pacearchaeota archaeon]|nr:hypothetical protein [Candidatus Pacearchaeota archaeon]MBD3283141.1 hypothetical protein [Candidatus Pacearchaeota archaeon]